MTILPILSPTEIPQEIRSRRLQSEFAAWKGKNTSLTLTLETVTKEQRAENDGNWRMTREYGHERRTLGIPDNYLHYLNMPQKELERVLLYELQTETITPQTAEIIRDITTGYHYMNRHEIPCSPVKDFLKIHNVYITVY